MYLYLCQDENGCEYDVLSKDEYEKGDSYRLCSIEVGEDIQDTNGEEVMDFSLPMNIDLTIIEKKVAKKGDVVGDYTIVNLDAVEFERDGKRLCRDKRDDYTKPHNPKRKTVSTEQPP